MGVEAYILIAIAIFGAVSIFILLSIKSAVEGNECRMREVDRDIEKLTKLIDERVPTASNPHYQPQYFVLQDVKKNTDKIMDPKTLRFELDRVSEKIVGVVDWVREEIKNSRPSGNFPYD